MIFGFLFASERGRELYCACCARRAFVRRIFSPVAMRSGRPEDLFLLFVLFFTGPSENLRIFLRAEVSFFLADFLRNKSADGFTELYRK